MVVSRVSGHLLEMTSPKSTESKHGWRMEPEIRCGDFAGGEFGVCRGGCGVSGECVNMLLT